eukprot:365095-Chlamydomonas_euryale.AAC.12
MLTRAAHLRSSPLSGACLCCLLVRPLITCMVMTLEASHLWCPPVLPICEATHHLRGDDIGSKPSLVPTLAAHLGGNHTSPFSACVSLRVGLCATADAGTPRGRPGGRPRERGAARTHRAQGRRG